MLSNEIFFLKRVSIKGVLYLSLSIRKILVTIDGSENSKKAAEYAISLTIKYNAQLIILYVLYSELGFAYSNLLGVATPKAINDVLKTQKKDVQKWFDEIKSKLKGTNIAVMDKIIISASSIVGEIIGFADKEKVDLIILGTRGRTGFKKLLLGSVAEGVVTHSSCPVMVVR
jgi:nucleotide-binding universal stress UspA family protein